MAGAPDETSEEHAEQGYERDGRPPPTPLPVGVIDERFALNIRERRDRVGMSQSELGRRMAALGWPWHPQTVQRVEGGQRKVSIGEAEAIAGILGTNVVMLMAIGREATLEWFLGSAAGRVRHSYRQIIAWANALAWQHRQLAATIEEAERSPFRDNERMAWLLSEAREAFEMSAEDAAAEGYAADPGEDEFITERHPSTLDEGAATDGRL